MKRILVRAPNWIGDQVMAFPFYSHLRRLYPDAWIGVVCTEWVRDIQFKGLIDQLFILPKKKSESLYTRMVNLKGFSNEVKQSGPWDLGIALPNSFGSALLLYWAGTRIRRGYNADARGFLLNQKIKWNASSDIHRAQAYINLLSPEEVLELGDIQFDPIRFWPDILPIDPPKQAYFVVAPGATADSRRWTVDQFSDLIQQISEKHGLKAVIVGGNAEKEVASQLFRRGIQIEDFTGRGWVAAHWKLFKEAKFTVCNESGLAHVAALCGSKVQIICGAADPRRTRPLGPGRVQVKVNPVECWPCEKNICQFTDERQNQCLKGISAETVREEIEIGFLSS